MAVAEHLHLIAIGGLDPSGGAGILRDGLTARAHGASFRLVGTAWAEQSPLHGVQAINPRPADELQRAIGLALKEAPPGRTAVKVGMAVNSSLLRTIASALEGFGGPVVFDPVVGATAGGALFDPGPVNLRQALAPLLARAWVVTPNVREASLICDRPVTEVDEAVWCGQVLANQGARAVVIKGGHLVTSSVVDVLVHAGRTHKVEGERIAGPNVRGTGCSYATSLALTLAEGNALLEACAKAQAHVVAGIRKARQVGPEWHLGHV